MEKPLIKYFKDGEWHYATVKDIGDLDMLNTFEKDTIVNAINSIVQNGEITNETTIANLNKISEKVRLIDEKIDNHIADRSNPHGVTASQVGAYTKAEVDSKDTSTLTSAKSYADGKANTVQNNLNAHANNRNNPHGVTAEQVDTYTKAVIDSKTSNTLTSSKTYTDGKISDLDTKITTHINDKSNPHNVTAEQVDTYTKEVIDQKSQGVLADAKSYIDSIKDYILDLINKTKQALQDYTYPKATIDSKDTSTLGTAKSYTETTKAEIIAGNVASATKLQTARAINGVYFDGTKDITLSADSLNTYNKQEVDAKVENATTISRDYTNEREVVVKEYTDNQIINAKSAVLADSKEYTDAEVLKAKNEIKAGNVYSATKLQTARNINGVAFDGTKNITLSVDNIGTYSKADIDSKDANVLGQAKAYVDSVRTAINGTISDSVTNAQNKTYTKTEIDGKDSATLSSAKAYTDTSISSAKTELNNNIAREKANIIAGNVASATKLQTARNINGAAFDGTRDISISAGQVGAYTKAETDNKISEKIGEIEIGGRNLAQGTSNEYSSKYSSFNGTINTCPYLAKVLTDGLSVGDTVTVRLLYKYTDIVETSGQTAKCWIQGSGNSTSWGSGAFGGSPIKTLAGSGEFEFLYSFKITAEHLKNTYWDTNIRHDYIQSGSVQWKMFKVEKGNKATDWSPAPEDMATKEDISTTLSQANKYSDTKKTEANSYTDTEIGKVKTIISGLNSSSVGTYSKTEIDNKDATVLSSSKSYTDTEISKIRTTVTGISPTSIGTYTKTEIDNKDTSTLTSAKSYADGKATTVQNNLNAHTGNRSNPHGVTASQVGAYSKGETYSRSEIDSKFSVLTTYSKSQIDEKDTTTLNNAKSYASSQVTDLRNHVIFVGTQAQWNALGTAEQNKYILKAIVE